MKVVAPERSSCASTPMNRTVPPYLALAAARSGASVMHGPHHDAQMFTSTGWPFCWAIRSWKAVGSIVGRASTGEGHVGALVVVAWLDVHATSAASATVGATTRTDLDVMWAW